MSESFEKLWSKKKRPHIHPLLAEAAKCNAERWYTAGLLRAAEIAEDGACKNTCSCPDCQPKHKIAAAIRKEAGDGQL